MKAQNSLTSSQQKLVVFIILYFTIYKNTFTFIGSLAQSTTTTTHPRYTAQFVAAYHHHIALNSWTKCPGSNGRSCWKNNFLLLEASSMNRLDGGRRSWKMGYNRDEWRWNIVCIIFNIYIYTKRSEENIPKRKKWTYRTPLKYSHIVSWVSDKCPVPPNNPPTKMVNLP